MNYEQNKELTLKEYYEANNIKAPKKLLDREETLYFDMSQKIQDLESDLFRVSNLNDDLIYRTTKAIKTNKINLIVICILSTILGCTCMSWYYEIQIKAMHDEINILSQSDLSQQNIELRKKIKDKESRCLFGICLK